MTISSQTATITAQGNGSNKDFAFDFLIPYQSDGVTVAIDVITTDSDGIQTLQTITTDYTVTGVGESAGGSVHYPVSGSALASDELITILRNLDYTQASAFEDEGFRASQVETAVDDLEMQLQQVVDKAARRSFGPQTVSELLSAQEYIGTTVTVTDATATTRLSVVAGGGSNVVLCYSNGQDWVIA